MSVTTTANVTTQSTLRLLADYELTHSGDDNNDVDPSLNERSSSELHTNPSWWPTDHHGVPPYRPINYNLDRDQRPWTTTHPVAIAFVWTMLNGVGVVACISKMWHNTGGRINDDIFRFSIGGER